MFMMKFKVNIKLKIKQEFAAAARKDKNPSNRTLHITEPDYFNQ